MLEKGTLLVFCGHQVQVSASQARVIAIIKRGLFSLQNVVLKVCQQFEIL